MGTGELGTPSGDKLPCTHIFLLSAECGFDPPKSTPLALSRETRPTQWLPLKRGTLILVPPFSRGVRGDQNGVGQGYETCVYTVAGDKGQWGLGIGIGDWANQFKIQS